MSHVTDTNESCHTWTSYITHLKESCYRPTQSIMYIPFQVNRFQKNILLIVQYKYSKSCSEDFFLQNPTKIWSSAQDHAVLHLLLNTFGFFISTRHKSAWWKWFVPQLYQLRRGILEGPALKYFYMIHRGGRSDTRRQILFVGTLSLLSSSTRQAITDGGDRISNNCDYQNFEQVFAGVPVYFKQFFSQESPKFQSNFHVSKRESPSLSWTLGNPVDWMIQIF